MQKILLASLILLSNAFFSARSCADTELADKDLKNIAEFAERIKSMAPQEGATNTYAITPQDRQLFNRDVQNSGVPGLQIPSNRHTDEAALQAKQILSKAMAPVQDDSINVSSSPDTNVNKSLIFISWSMGLPAIRQLLAEASQDQNIVLVFRGVKNIEDMGKSLKEISELARPYSPTPRVMLNPTYFQKFNITQVPSLVLYDESNDRLLGKVVGLSNPDWISRRIKETKETDFGVKGPALAIAELDIIEVMKDRASKIDWAKKKENANNRFWKNQQFLTLPRASKSLSRALDPSIEVTDDILDGNGGVLVKRGTIINPLDLKTFDKAILVFDPLDKAQLKFAKAKNIQFAKEGKSVILIATQFDKSKNWDSYKEITAEFNAPVFKLTPDIRERFMLTVSPSIVTADRKSFYVEEINVSGENL